jgi:hypothetical protein
MIANFHVTCIKSGITNIKHYKIFKSTSEDNGHKFKM